MLDEAVEREAGKQKDLIAKRVFTLFPVDNPAHGAFEANSDALGFLAQDLILIANMRRSRGP